ncbi:hypothetical protein GCM10027299_51430 [Larkinella ripae]
MKPQFIFSFLRIGTSFLYYAMIAITVLVFAKGVLGFFGNPTPDRSAQFSHEVVAHKVTGTGSGAFLFDSGGPIRMRMDGREPGTAFSADSLLQFHPIVNRYRLEIKPKSVLGYYSFAVVMLNCLLVIGILGLFRRIFSEASVREPFKAGISNNLVRLALLFAVSDGLKLIHYLVFNRLVEQHLSNPGFDLMTEIGSGFITGLIVYAIAIIYQRGLSIQEENALTV